MVVLATWDEQILIEPELLHISATALQSASSWMKFLSLSTCQVFVGAVLGK